MSKFEFPFRGENKRLTPEERANLPGEFIQLPDGVTHYEMGGPVNGPVVILLHGFSVPNFIWEPTFKALTEAGFWVLRYDHYGRGYSDRPFGKYDKDLFVRQLVSLLDMLGFKDKVSLLGLSMGGTIAASFADKNPKRVDKLGLIDPAGFPINYPFVFKLLLIPILGELLVNLIGDNNIEKLLANDFYEPKHIQKFADQFRPQMQYKGFKRALLSTVREGVLSNGIETYRTIGKSDLQVLLFWGEEDTTVPFKYSAKLVELIPQVEFHPIEKTGHIPHFEKAEEVNPILIDFLRN